MFPFAGSGDTAWHTAPTLGDDWIKKVTDPIIAFKLHSMWARVINVMIIHITPMLPQWIFSHLVSIRWHVTLIIKHGRDPLRQKHFKEKSTSETFEPATSSSVGRVSFYTPGGHCRSFWSDKVQQHGQWLLGKSTYNQLKQSHHMSSWQSLKKLALGIQIAVG